MKSQVKFLAIVWLLAGQGMTLTGLAALPMPPDPTTRPAGTVASWGYSIFLPAFNPSERFVEVAARGGVTLALKSDGTVAAWGTGSPGQATVPPNLSGVRAIATGWYHNLALKGDGTVVAWGGGANYFGERTVPEGLNGVVGIAAEGQRSLALKSDGTVVAWGSNSRGESTVPVGLSGVVAIAAGHEHSLALKSDGTVVAWGFNVYGQCSVPPGLSGVAAISAGYAHSLALKSNGTVVAWGSNTAGQGTVPPGLSGIVAIAAGGYNSLALRGDGTVVAWGANDQGQSSVPAGLGGVAGLAAGYSHGLAIVTAPESPQFDLVPQNQTVTAGTTVVFTALAQGASPITYQWQFNGTNLAGATNTSLTLSNVQLAAAGSYSVRASDGGGNTRSAAATLVVTALGPIAHWRFDEAPGSILVADSAGNYNGTLSPTGASFVAGGRSGNALSINRSANGHANFGNILPFTNGSFTISAWIRPPAGDTTFNANFISKHYSGYANGYILSYGWFAPLTNKALLYFGTRSTNGIQEVVTSTTDVNDGGWHQVVGVYQAGGSTTIYVDGAPVEGTIATSPIAGNNAPFIVGGNMLGSAVETRFMGLVDDVQVYDRALGNDEVHFLFQNPGQALTSNVPVIAPFIVVPPTNLTVSAGSNATFAVTAGGTAPLSYQWLFNGTNVLGATNATLTLANVQTSQAGTYLTRVTNPGGTVQSQPAVLTVTPVGGGVGAFTNGSFELPVIEVNTVIPNGPGAITAWTVGGAGPVSFVTGPSFGVPPSSGSQMIEFNAGNSMPGDTLAQTFTTTPGQAYTVSFNVARTPANAAGTMSIQGTVTSSSGQTLGTLNGVAPSSGWSAAQTFTFTATTATSTLTFLDTSLATVAVDVLLDNVTVVSGIQPPLGPVAHWRFDESPGATVAVDSAGNYPGVLSAAGAAFTTGGRAGNALTLNRAAGGFVNMGNVLSLTNTSFSLAAWVRMAAAETADTGLVHKHWSGTPNNGYYMGVNTPGGGLGQVNRAYFYTGAANTANPASTTVVNDGNWHQIVTVYELGGATAIYVDGAPAETISTSPPIAANGASFLIGGYSPGGVPAGSLSGSVDDVQVYARALGAGEIEFLFRNPGHAVTNMLPPVITVPPQSLTVPAGGSATFTVTAAGSSPLSYQWRFQGTNLVGATNAALTLAGVQTNQAGLYSVVVSNAAGSVTSSNVSLSVVPVQPLNIVQFSSTQFTVTESAGAALITIVRSGSSTGAVSVAVVTVAGTATAGVDYISTAQTVIWPPGSTNHTFTVPILSDGLVETDESFGVQLSNPLGCVLGVLSNATVTITANLAPVITTQPVSRAVVISGSTTFSVTATGLAPLAYQWRFNGGDLVGGTNAALTLGNVQTNHAGIYSVVVSNAAGSVTSSNAVLTVVQPYATNLILNAVDGGWYDSTGQHSAANQNYLAGKADGRSHRNWFAFDIPMLPGVVATAQLRINTYTNRGPDPAEHYQLRHVNAPVSVLRAGGSNVSLYDDLGDGDIFGGRNVALSDQPQIIAILLNEAACSNITSATGGSFAIGGEVTTLRTDSAGDEFLFGFSDSVAGGKVQLALDIIPVPGFPFITAQPIRAIVPAGSNATFTVGAGGAAPLHYQWRFNGVNLPDATNATLALLNVQTNQTGLYSVAVSNSVGGVASASATLRVYAPGPLDFHIVSLTASNSQVVDHDYLTGDDRGGIAVSSSQVFVTGDSATARFSVLNLMGGTGVGRLVDGLCSDLRTETVYALGNGTNALASGGLVTTLIELDGTTGQPTGVVIPLSQSISLGSSSGIFSGFGRVVLHTGTRVFDILLPSGVVSDLGAMTRPNWAGSETWAIWGVAEFIAGELHLAYRSSASSSIFRSRVPDGMVEVIASFTNLSDLSSFTVSPQLGRWYFHHESGSQFGGSSETLGYADAAFAFNSEPTPPVFLQQPQNRATGVSSNVSFSVSVRGTAPLSYQWRFNGTNLAGATNATLALFNVQTNQAGLYSVAVSNALGGAVSSNATLTVTVPPPVFVFRTLLPLYLPGSRFTVTLTSSPPAGTLSHAVEDLPPSGWTVTNISFSGVFDSVNRKVKFGPFFDTTPRVLTYDVTPSASATGSKLFSGTSSVDGVNTTIGGASIVNRSSGHPADNNPPDFRLTIAEATAYGAAWKTGATWPVTPNPIPISYVTRAGALWRAGETYIFDATITNAPLWWVSLTTNGVVPQAVRLLSAGPLPLSAPPGLAESDLPGGFQRGRALTVHVRARPAAGVQVYAVEDALPAGWTLEASSITEGGSFDGLNGKVKWGPFFDNAERTLAYRVNPGTNISPSAFAGTASFDGADVPIIGRRVSLRSPWLPESVNSGRDVRRDGFRVQVQGESGRTYVLEGTDTPWVANSWLPLATNLNGGTDLDFTDSAATNRPARFYRVIER